MMEFQKRMADRGWSQLPLRLLLGFGLAAHGLAKLERGPEQFAVVLAALGVPAPHWAAWATALFELLGGLSILAGLFVTAWSLPLAVVMLTAMFAVHLPYGFSSVKLRAVDAAGAQFGPPGYELNLLYLVGLLSLVLGGSGRGSLECWLRRWRDQRRAADAVAVGAP
ncbi:MAG TPA: DoxX family protein [Polyangiaceae bacterium]|nr:DoxX family protein [Polyangiaceae bacterium]